MLRKKSLILKKRAKNEKSKNYYGCLIEEINICKNSDYHTYKNTSLDQEDILEYYKSSLSSLNILINQENDDLPILFFPISFVVDTLIRIFFSQ
jgi:uncharacterized protein YceK